MYYYKIQRSIYKYWIFLFSINLAYGLNEQYNINTNSIDLLKFANQLPNHFNMRSLEKLNVGNHIVYRVNINNSTNRVLKLEFATQCHYFFKLNNTGGYLSFLTLNPGESSGMLYSYDYKEFGCLAPSNVGRNIGISFKYDNDLYPAYAVLFHTEYYAGDANKYEVFYFIDGRNSVSGEFLSNLQKIVGANFFGNENIRNKIAYSIEINSKYSNKIYDYNIDVLKDLVIDKDVNQVRYIKAFINPYKQY